jgi:putative transcriptional regulator
VGCIGANLNGSSDFLGCIARDLSNKIPHCHRSVPQGRPMLEQADIKNNIRRLRFENGEMTQDELAKGTGVTRHTFMALEAAKYLPSLLLAFRIVQAFEVPLEDVCEVNSTLD